MKKATLESDVKPPYSLTRFGKERPIELAWLFLALAIASEVIGLTAMKATVARGHFAGYILLYLLISLSYFFLSKAVKTISMGVAYAIWEGSGIALITLVSTVTFEHILTVREMTGIAMALAGILMVNAGAVHDQHTVPLEDRRGII